VFGGGHDAHDAGEGMRSRVVRGRPNWLVILAVSLGLMALLVATAGGTATGPHRAGGPSEAAAQLSPRADAHHAGRDATTTTTTTTATTTAPAMAPKSPSVAASTDVASSLHSTGTSGTAGTPAATSQSAPAAPSATTTTLAPVTTTTLSGGSMPADRTQTQGYLNPPLQSSNQFGFTGTGAMEVSVLWSGNTYLTLQVSCPSGSQNVGGTSAMAASLPDASGNCLATVSEPASETTSLTYTITIGPSGG
jgi:hypothetical protein